MSACPIGSSITTFARSVVVFLTLTVSSLAAGQAVPTIGGSGTGGSKIPYRGTSVSYGHSISAYNPSPEEVVYAHRLGLMPEWHFADEVWVRSRFFLTQELTPSNSTNTRSEVELSDLWLDGVWAGFREKHTGIRIAGDLRATFPTSKQSRAASRIFTLGPSANVSRSFKVLAGLTLVYSARFTYRFNRFSTRQNQGAQILNCTANVNAGLAEGGFIDACNNTNTGSTNLQFDLIHGPTVSFSPHERLNVSASLFMQRGWVPALAGGEVEGVPFPGVPAQTRDFIGFSLGITYQPWDLVGFTLGAFSFANQLDTTGRYIFPLFNRSTAASIDATFDLEALVSSITKEKK